MKIKSIEHEVINKMMTAMIHVTNDTNSILGNNLSSLSLGQPLVNKHTDSLMTLPGIPISNRHPITCSIMMQINDSPFYNTDNFSSSEIVDITSEETEIVVNSLSWNSTKENLNNIKDLYFGAIFYK